MKSKLNIVVILFCALIISACNTVLDVELPEREPKLVVNCLFEQDSQFVFDVSVSKEILDTVTLRHLEGAKIVLSASDGTSETISTSQMTVVGFETKRAYVSNMRATVGLTYSIEVSHPEYSSVTSSASVESGVKITSIDTSVFIESNFGEQFPVLRMSVGFDDPVGEDYYELKVYKYGKIVTYEPPNFEPDTILSFEEVYYYFPSESLLSDLGASTFDDELFEGQSYKVTVNISSYYLIDLDGFPTDTTSPSFLLPELRSISPEYYKYQTSLSRYRNAQGDPFAQPVQVYNNIDGGFGIFAGFSKSSDTLNLR
jgi:hypothetical protein